MIWIHHFLLLQYLNALTPQFVRVLVFDIDYEND